MGWKSETKMGLKKRLSRFRRNVFRMVCSVAILWKRYWACVFTKVHGISWPAQRLSLHGSSVLRLSSQNWSGHGHCMISCCLQSMNFAQEGRKPTEFSSNTICCVHSPLRTSRFRLQSVKKLFLFSIVTTRQYADRLYSRSVSDASLFVITLSCYFSPT